MRQRRKSIREQHARTSNWLIRRCHNVCGTADQWALFHYLTWDGWLGVKVTKTLAMSDATVQQCRWFCPAKGSLNMCRNLHTRLGIKPTILRLAGPCAMYWATEVGHYSKLFWCWNGETDSKYWQPITAAIRHDVSTGKPCRLTQYSMNVG